MTTNTKVEIDLTVRSFSYVAKQLAKSSHMQYEQILREAEKHRSALLLIQRDLMDKAEQGLRRKTITRTEFDRVRAAATQAVSQARQTITCIAAQYVPQKLAA
jgi:hypothetical protein